MKLLQLITIMSLMALMACGSPMEISQVGPAGPQGPPGAPAASPTPSPPVYVGCFTDNSTRALPAFLMTTGATVETCIEAARTAGYKFAGLQYGIQCFAGNEVGYQVADDDACNMPCDADRSEICGGAWHNSVYTTGIE
jgi:hypothetical protein